VWTQVRQSYRAPCLTSPFAVCQLTSPALRRAVPRSFDTQGTECGSIACFAAMHMKILYNWPAFCLHCVSALDTPSFLPLSSHHTAQNCTVYRAALSVTRLHDVLAGICEGGSNRELTQFFVISRLAMLFGIHLFVLLVALLVCL